MSECMNCGTAIAGEAQAGCWCCDLCSECTPSACRCPQGIDARRDDYAQLRIDDRNERGA